MPLFGVWVQPVQNDTSEANLQKYGEVTDLEEAYAGDDATVSAAFCDGQTSATPPRYANDDVSMIYTYSRETADMLSGILRDHVAERVVAGELVFPVAPAWIGNSAAPVFAVTGAVDMASTVLLLREELAISEAVTNGQIESQVIAYMGQTGRTSATVQELAEFIADNAAWS